MTDIRKIFSVHYQTVLRWEKSGFLVHDFVTLNGKHLYTPGNIEKTLIKRMGEKYGKEMWADILLKIEKYRQAEK
jgi:DNA-binding transcriptional MerR regulator